MLCFLDLSEAIFHKLTSNRALCVCARVGTRELVSAPAMLAGAPLPHRAGGTGRFVDAHRGAFHTHCRQHPVGLGHGVEYLACWLETELIIDIKRELALFRQMLPDARITGSTLLPRWVWVGARKVTAVDKIRGS